MLNDKVFCKNCKYLEKYKFTGYSDDNERCCMHDNARYIDSRPYENEIYYRSISIRNMNNNCKDFKLKENFFIKWIQNILNILK